MKLEAKKAAMALRRAPAEKAAREAKVLTLPSKPTPNPTPSPSPQPHPDKAAKEEAAREEEEQSAQARREMAERWRR